MVKGQTSSREQELNEKKQKKEADLSEVRTYEFYNLEEPGQMLKFSYGSTKKPEKFTFFHGGKYSMKKEVAEHLESRQTPIWSFRPDGSGKIVKHLAGWKARFQLRETRA